MSPKIVSKSGLRVFRQLSARMFAAHSNKVHEMCVRGSVGERRQKRKPWAGAAAVVMRSSRLAGTLPATPDVSFVYHVTYIPSYVHTCRSRP